MRPKVLTTYSLIPSSLLSLPLLVFIQTKPSSLGSHVQLKWLSSSFLILSQAPAFLISHLSQQFETPEHQTLSDFHSEEREG